MTEDNDYQVLKKEIKDLRQRIDRLTTSVEMLAVFIVSLIILNYLFSSGGFIFILSIIALAILIAICCWNMENKGI
jgi:hypothetical protein